MRLRLIFGFLTGILFLAITAGASPAGAQSRDFSKVPVSGMVTMIDLGATQCIPCKAMAPILEKMEKVYQGKAAVFFIDVWKDKAPAERFRIRAIPTQIFFDREGKEVYRHVGFMSEPEIVAQLEKMGVK